MGQPRLSNRSQLWSPKFWLSSWFLTLWCKKCSYDLQSLKHCSIWRNVLPHHVNLAQHLTVWGDKGIGLTCLWSSWKHKSGSSPTLLRPVLEAYSGMSPGWCLRCLLGMLLLSVGGIHGAMDKPFWWKSFIISYLFICVFCRDSNL